MNATVVNEEVFVTTDSIVRVGQRQIELLKARVASTARKRIRLCAHRDVNDALHEMLIVVTRETYVRPHKHLAKAESFHVIEGTCDMVIFDDAGIAIEVIRMGPYASGRTFYYRLSEPRYHVLLVSSDYVVFHESGTGPFRSADTVCPVWAPEEQDLAGRAVFVTRLRVAADALIAAQGVACA